MKRTLIRLPKLMLWTFWMIPLLLATQVANAVLTHEWSFNDAPGSTTVADSVGNATGTLTGCTLGGGQISLNGAGDYIHLPSGILPNLTNATFEFWTTWSNPPVSGVTRCFDFGTNNGTAGVQWINVAPDGNNSTLQYPRFVINDGTGGAPANAATSFPVGQEVCVTAVYNDSAQLEILYLNGSSSSPIASATTTKHIYNIVNDAMNNIGKSQFAADPTYDGSFDEFRIYNNAFDPAQVEADYEAGPNSTSGSPGSLSSLQFNNPTNVFIGAQFSPSVLATYSSLNNQVNLTGQPGITYSSDDTNVIAFEADGNFHALAIGSATLHASYQSQIATLTVTVSEEPTVLIHRYSFNGTPGSTTITDSVGGANATLMNGTATATLTGTGQLTLDGNSSDGYVSLPSGMMATLTNATFVTWVNNQDPFSDGATLWTFGTNNGVSGIRYIALFPNLNGPNTLRFDVHTGSGGGTSIVGPSPLPLSNEVCVAVAYNSSAQTVSIYEDGRKVATGSTIMPLYTIPDVDNYIGQSQYYGNGQAYLNAILDEFRIYSGVESDLQIAIDAAAGPNNVVTSPGALVSLTVQASSTNVDIHGAGVPIQVLANFANVTNVDVAALSQTTFSSSNPSVGTIVNGNFVPKNVGTSMVTATYGGVSGSVVLDVVDTNAWPTLLHRWDFNEPSGSSTITDSVGSIDGTVYGPMTFTGQEMITPNPNPAPDSSGLPALTNGWVSFPASQGLVTGLPNEASFEIWVVWNGGPVYQEMFDFGQAATPGYSLGGYEYVMMCPKNVNNQGLRVEWDQNPSGYDVKLDGPTLPTNQLCQIVWTHDQDRQLDKLYLNGQLVGTAANTALWSSLPDTDNWLARDEWQDPMFSGAYADFRIWNGSLTAGQVANLYAAGPNVIVGPSLQITPGNSQVTLKWPANATGFTLQSTTDLIGGTWSTVSGTPTVVNGLNNLTLPTPQHQTYYRLKQ